MQPQPQQWPPQQGGYTPPAPAWNQPEAVQSFSWDNLHNQTVIWIQGGYHPVVQTQSFGAKPAARGTLIVLTGQFAGQAYEDRLVFGQKMLSQLSAYPQGFVLLARVVPDGKSVVFDRYGDYDAQVASHWQAQNPGLLERHVAGAVNNFHEESRKMAASPGGQAPVNPAPQWQPPAGQYPQGTQPGYGQPLPQQQPNAVQYADAGLVPGGANMTTGPAVESHGQQAPPPPPMPAGPAGPPNQQHVQTYPNGASGLGYQQPPQGAQGPAQPAQPPTQPVPAEDGIPF